MLSRFIIIIFAVVKNFRHGKIESEFEFKKVFPVPVVNPVIGNFPGRSYIGPGTFNRSCEHRLAVWKQGNRISFYTHVFFRRPVNVKPLAVMSFLNAAT